jgi:hypothetical protein
MENQPSTMIVEAVITIAISLVTAKVISHFMVKHIEKKLAKNS